MRTRLCLIQPRPVVPALLNASPECAGAAHGCPACFPAMHVLTVLWHVFLLSPHSLHGSATTATSACPESDLPLHPRIYPEPRWCPTLPCAGQCNDGYFRLSYEKRLDCVVDRVERLEEKSAGEAAAPSLLLPGARGCGSGGGQAGVPQCRAHLEEQGAWRLQHRRCSGCLAPGQCIAGVGSAALRPLPASARPPPTGRLVATSALLTPSPPAAVLASGTKLPCDM